MFLPGAAVGVRVVPTTLSPQPTSAHGSRAFQTCTLFSSYVRNRKGGSAPQLSFLFQLRGLLHYCTVISFSQFSLSSHRNGTVLSNLISSFTWTFKFKELTFPSYVPASPRFLSCLLETEAVLSHAVILKPSTPTH